MPPVMGIAAFLMAEFLGRSYFDVVARGYAPAIIYYVGVSVSVYLLSTRYRARLGTVVVETMRWTDWMNIAAFVGVVGGLIAVMAVLHLAPMFAALYVFLAVGGALVTAHPGCDRAGARPVVAQPRRPFRALRGLFCEHDSRSDAPARDAFDHDRRARHYRRADEDRRTADRGRRGQPRRPGDRRLLLRRAARNGAAAGADLHHHRPRDRAGNYQGWRRPVGRALLRLLSRGLGRGDAAHFDLRRSDLEDRGTRPSCRRCSTRLRSASRFSP